MIKENKSLVSHRDDKNLRCKLKFQVLNLGKIVTTQNFNSENIWAF